MAGETMQPLDTRTHAAMPELAVRIALPDLDPWVEGNILRGVWSFTASEPGPHLLITAAIHGNEIAGAVLLERWLSAGLRPQRGRLTLAFGNIDALLGFDPADPTASRFIDEDLNRLWDAETLASGRRSVELRRARALLPVIESADILFDLHSMLWPSDPLLLVGQSAPAARLALGLCVPPLVVADHGHLDGRRLIDYPTLHAPGRLALLVEAGRHWDPTTVAIMELASAQLLRRLGMATAEELLLPPAPPVAASVRFAEVTTTITASTDSFVFLQPCRGGDVIGPRNTLIALDGDREVRTPHDDCLLVMPGLRALPGQTAVRLGRFAAPP
jgi:predicted deacylase